MKYASAKLAWKWRSFRCSRSSCPAQDGPALSYYLWPSYFLLFLLFFLLNLPSCCPPAVLFKLSVCTQNAVVPASVHFADLACKLQPTFVPAISTRRSLGFLSSLWNIYSWQIFFNNFLINLPSWRVGFFSAFWHTCLFYSDFILVFYMKRIFVLGDSMDWLDWFFKFFNCEWDSRECYALYFK